MKWKIRILESTSKNLKFRIDQNSSEMTNIQVFELLMNSDEFSEFYNTQLSKSNFSAFYWENKPLNVHTMDGSYECNLVNSKALAHQAPDPHTFRNHFRKDQSVVSFMNLGGDALLIAPCPVKRHPGYSHIGTFVRTADKGQIREFWMDVASATIDTVGDSPVWLSTSGLGVSWLHARIDSRPKYYQTEEYKLI